eukprot:401714_1
MNVVPKGHKLKPGEAVFHHALSVHGSFPNRSKTARRAAVLNYFRDGTYSNTDEALLSGMNVVPKGHKLKPGEAVFHHALSVHGSFPNRSKTARRAAVLNYFRDGTYSNTDEALLSGIDVVPKGHKLQTAFHPVVYDPLWKEG